MTIYKNIHTDGNQYEEPCVHCQINNLGYLTGHCSECNDTGWKPALIECHDKWWIRFLKWIIK